MFIENFSERYENLENVHIYCFDIMQYNHDIKKLFYTLFANFEGKVYFSEIEVKTYLGCVWKENKWELNSIYKNIAILGLEDILMNLKNNNKLLY